MPIALSICDATFEVKNGSGYLGSKIVGSAAQRPDRCITIFCEAEIGYLDVPIEVEKDILRFQVAVNDIE